MCEDSYNLKELNTSVEDDEESTDIDLLNHETFGDANQLDWQQEEHEHYALHLKEEETPLTFDEDRSSTPSRPVRNVDDEIKNLQEQMIQYVLDDEDELSSEKKHVKEEKLPPQGKIFTLAEVERQIMKTSPDDENQTQTSINQQQQSRLTMEQYVNQGALPRTPGILRLPNNMSNQNLDGPNYRARRPHNDRMQHPHPRQTRPFAPIMPRGRFPPPLHPGPFPPPQFVDMHMQRGGMTPRVPPMRGRPILGANRLEHNNRYTQPSHYSGMQTPMPPPYMFQTQRHFGNPNIDNNRPRMHQPMRLEYEDNGNFRPRDDYANLMTDKEKHFLLMMMVNALNISDAFHDDFYFTVMSQRQNNSAASRMNQPNMNNQQRANPRATPFRENLPFAPPHFENALGKIQVGSVSAPRRIIESDLVDNVEGNQRGPNDRRSKQLLMEVENLYFAVHFVLDNRYDLSDRLRQRDILLAHILTRDNLVNYLGVNKGTHIIMTILQFLYEPLVTERLFGDATTIIKRYPDYDNFMAFLPFIRMWMPTADLSQVIELVDNWDEAQVFTNRFTLTILSHMVQMVDDLMKAGQLLPANKKLWQKLLLKLARACANNTQTERPTNRLDRNMVIHHLLPLIGDIVSTEVFENFVNSLSQ